MAGNGEGEAALTGNTPETSCSFVWDGESNLYYHASTGFYHDPVAGWYYSSRDGAYYRYENGNYVPVESTANEGFGDHQHTESVMDEPFQITPANTCYMDYDSTNESEKHRPTSEWLEETLINLYLMGHSKEEVGTKNDATKANLEEDGKSNKNAFEPHSYGSASEKFFTCQSGSELRTIEENRETPEETPAETSDEFWNEEKWQAQYGQVVKPNDEHVLDCPVIDLWDWSVVGDITKHQVARLVGRLVRQSKKLHPSLSAGGLFKTAAIREVHLDLVRVASGKVYRLRNPDARYLASMSAYDASNPTKDWGYPDLYSMFALVEGNTSQAAKEVFSYEGSSASSCPDIAATNEDICLEYRDRAAERRALHGGYGIGPGQKNFSNDDAEETYIASENETINYSLGPGSYARRILENMGWKEGEALGKTKNGLLEPLQAIGNKGNAGLGWSMGHAFDH